MVNKDKVEMRERTSGRGQKRGIREQVSGHGRKRAVKPSTREEGGSSSAAAQKNNAVKFKAVSSLDVLSSVATSLTCSA